MKELVELMQNFTDDLLETNIEPYKLLMVGNSFASDAANWLWDICQSADIDVVVGVIDIGGCSLEEHWENVESDQQAPFFTRDKTGTNNLFIPYQDIFSYDHWDVITFQQFSGLSGIYNSFQPYLTNLRNYARKCATNPDVVFGWHATWAYATDSRHPEFIHYNNDQKAMYDAIMNATQQVMEKMDFDILIPSGTAIQNARTNSDLQKIGYELTSDGHHLDFGMGRFVAALTVFETLMANKYEKNLINDVSFYPENNGGTKHLSQLAKIAAMNAVLQPYQVTDISDANSTTDDVEPFD